MNSCGRLNSENRASERDKGREGVKVEQGEIRRESTIENAMQTESVCNSECDIGVDRGGKSESDPRE